MGNISLVRSFVATIFVMALLAIANVSIGLANAQVSGATLSGTISDPSGAVVAGAQVSIANRETGVTRAVTTDAGGLYSAPNLLPGAYDVTVTATGFSTTSKNIIKIFARSTRLLCPK